MVEFLIKLLLVARSRLRSRARLEAENLVLRQQVIVLSRKSRSRVWLRNIDRLIFVWLYRLFPSILNAITLVKPETVIGWHRRGFRAYWRWKSRRRGCRCSQCHMRGRHCSFEPTALSLPACFRFCPRWLLWSPSGFGFEPRWNLSSWRSDIRWRFSAGSGPVDRGFAEAIACCGPSSTELGPNA